MAAEGRDETIALPFPDLAGGILARCYDMRTAWRKRHAEHAAFMSLQRRLAHREERFLPFRPLGNPDPPQIDSVNENRYFYAMREEALQVFRAGSVACRRHAVQGEERPQRLLPGEAKEIVLDTVLNPSGSPTLGGAPERKGG